MEVVQIICTGFYVEILEIDDGAYFLLSVRAHERLDWNIMSDHPSGVESAGESHYRFQTLEHAKEALRDLISAVL